MPIRIEIKKIIFFISLISKNIVATGEKEVMRKRRISINSLLVVRNSHASSSSCQARINPTKQEIIRFSLFRKIVIKIPKVRTVWMYLSWVCNIILAKILPRYA